MRWHEYIPKGWIYQPDPSKKEQYSFDGEIYSTARIEKEIPMSDQIDMVSAVTFRIDQVGGLDRIQKFREVKSGKQVWIVDNTIEKEGESGVCLMFSDEYDNFEKGEVLK